jgi:hypothetical protein
MTIAQIEIDDVFGLAFLLAVKLFGWTLNDAPDAAVADDDDIQGRHRGGQVFLLPLADLLDRDRPHSKKTLRQYPIAATKGCRFFPGNVVLKNLRCSFVCDQQWVHARDMHNKACCCCEQKSASFSNGLINIRRSGKDLSSCDGVVLCAVARDLISGYD